MDTQETVEVKPMESHECQEELDFEKAAERKAVGPAEVAAAAPVPEPTSG